MPDDAPDRLPDRLPDRALRSALEFAVGLAAAGQRTRPPLAFPLGLKPFLKVQTLPTAALAKVRAAVEADAKYRATLAGAARPDLVDEVGMLWLQRPEGWQQAASALVEAAERARLGARDAAGVRREVKRREAAEAAGEKARAELAIVRAQLETERSARAGAVAELALVRAELAAMATRLEETERMARRRTAGAAEADARAGAVEDELAGLRAELAEAVAARDAALAAAAHGEGRVDLERVRVLLTEALVLSKGATPRARSHRRKPVALPGAVYGKPLAEAEYLLRTRDVVVLVDGYNVAKLGWPDLTLEQQRRACIEGAERIARRWGTLVHVVFDGADVVGAHAGGRRLVRVSFSPAGVLADDVLRAEVDAIDTHRPVVVVTSDQAVVQDVRANGANTLPSDVFLALARP